MEAGKDVRYQNAPRVQGDELIFAFVMEVVKGASLMDVRRVHKEAQISARPMVEVKDARGARQDQNLVDKLPLHVIDLRGGRLDYVLLIMRWCKTNVSMAVEHWGLLHQVQNVTRMRR